MSNRVEQIGDCTLYLADCMDVLPTLGKVDAVVTDPPYAIRNKFGSQKKLDGTRRLQFSWDTEEMLSVSIAAMDMACDLADSFFTFCGVSQVSLFESALESRFTVKPAVWIKSCPPPAMKGNWWPSGFEFALYGYRHGAHFDDKNPKRKNVFYSDTYRAGIRADEKVEHPTQKWLPLMEEIVSAMIRTDGVALDPFMGSGTTGVACVKMGRKFIGIEREPEYFDIACRRIEQAYAQPDMFIQQAAESMVQEVML